jgi:hypothetical protein
MDSEDESIVVRKLAGAKLVSVTRAGTKGDFWIGISRSNDNEQCHAKVVAFVPLKDSSTEIQILRPRQTTQQCAESEVWSLKNGSLVHRLESRPRDISERSSDRNIRQ